MPDPLTFKYTNQTAIATRLSKRLQVGGAPTTYGKDVLDLALLQLIAPQVEARFEAAINHLYVTPLVLSDTTARAIVASAVEKLILAEILPTQFFPEVGREGGLRKVMADEGNRELGAIKDGTIKLEGERVPLPAVPISGAVRVVRRGTRNPGAAELIEW